MKCNAEKAVGNPEEQAERNVVAPLSDLVLDRMSSAQLRDGEETR
jgi:hypothetical protein